MLVTQNKSNSVVTRIIDKLCNEGVMYKYLNLNHRTKSLFPIPQLNAFINLKFD